MVWCRCHAGNSGKRDRWEAVGKDLVSISTSEYCGKRTLAPIVIHSALLSASWANKFLCIIHQARHLDHLWLKDAWILHPPKIDHQADSCILRRRV